jgi:hypothetical protein
MVVEAPTICVMGSCGDRLGTMRGTEGYLLYLSLLIFILKDP